MSEPSAVGPVIYDLFELLSDEEEDVAFHTFFGNELGHDQEHDETILFEEWLLFDWRDNDDRPLLARGLDKESFTSDQRERCRQLMNNIYSYWQVVDAIPGYSVTLEDVYTDKQYKLRHPRYSRELPIDSIFCARIALVNNRWTPASGFIEPRVLHFTRGNRSDFFGKRPEALSPRTLLRERRKQAERLLSGEPTTLPAMSFSDAKQSLQKALVNAELSRLVGAETVEQWIRMDMGRTTKQLRHNPYPLALSLLHGLSIGQSETAVRRLITAAASLQQVMYGQETHTKQTANRSSGSFVSTLDPDEWMDLFDEASAQLHAGNASEAVEWFEQAFEVTHKNRSTNPLVFRQLHNAALSYFYSGEEILGRKVLDASLALNPGYDLGRQTKAALDAGKLDEVLQLTTTLRQAQQAANAKRKRRPLHHYSGRRTSPIIHYFEWLKDLGINFYDDNPTVKLHAIGSETEVGPAVNHPDVPQKPGRNEPCPCGKKKPDGTPIKYKHCHGEYV